MRQKLMQEQLIQMMLKATIRKKLMSQILIQQNRILKKNQMMSLQRNLKQLLFLRLTRRRNRLMKIRLRIPRPIQNQARSTLVIEKLKSVSGQ
jgi:hypothetical protein